MTRHRSRYGMGIMGLLLLAGPGHATDLRATWKDGLRFESSDKAVQLKLGGRVHNDWAFFFGDSAVKNAGFALTDGTEFRNARLYMSGVLYERLGFKAQFDFTDGDTDFKDVYLEALKIPVVGTIRVGQFKEPFGLDEVTSSNHITFLERALPNALVPARNTGLMLISSVLGNRLTWAAGIFRDTGNFGDGQSGDDYNLTARVTGLPWFAEEGARLLHLGLAYRHGWPNGDVARYRSRPEAHLAPMLIDTGNFASTSSDQLGGETALVWGPFSVQGEYVYSMNRRPAAATATFAGFYAQAGYFLTGEHRAYKPGEAAFTRLAPHRNAFQDGGAGAWELAARYSELDLNDAGIAGGTLRDLTAGMNWYLNPNMRVMLNYGHARLVGTGNANIFQTRFQVDF